MNNCTKITPDNLRDIVLNFEELEEWLKENYPCLLPQYYEEKPYVVQPELHSACLPDDSRSTKRYDKLREQFQAVNVTP